MTAADYPVLHLLPGHDRRVRMGYPWVFSNEIRIDETARAVPLGGLVRLADAGGKVFATAGYNRHALIAARLLAARPETVDQAFLEGRLRRALALREALFARPFYRLVFAEADGLPGLVLDRYGAVAVVQANTAAMDRLLPLLVPAIAAVLRPDAVILRNDSAARTAEGLDQHVRLAAGSLSGPIRLEENGAVFLADPLGGQKTGWFYDQRDNRAFAARLAAGRSVLDCYSHTGGFGVLAARAGAVSVTAIDRSQPALDLAVEAAAVNGVSARFAAERADVFEALEALGRDRRRFGLVVVDPPAFVKTKKDLPAGLRGYRKLARLAAAAVEPGGFLLAASCSHHVGPQPFLEQVGRGLVDAGRMGRVLAQTGAGPDHPVHPLLPESAYLKAVALQLD